MLVPFGFSPCLEESFRPFAAAGLAPGRVVFASREICCVWADTGELTARISGRLRHTLDPDAFPVVGDWVALRVVPAGPALVEAVLPRRGVLARKEPGRGSGRQLLACHVDVALLVQAADHVNPRALERYVATACDGGVRPVVVLSKVDRVADPAAAIARASSAVLRVPVVPVSAVGGDGLGALIPWLERGVTAALLGPSGVGKTTLVNVLAGGSPLATAPVRTGDGKGRHTTTARQLFALPWGAFLVDTPGLRELGLAGEAAGFDDVDVLAAGCRFRDCRHDREPGCAVLAALENGSLSPARADSYRKLRREAAWAAERETVGAAAAEKRRWKQIRMGSRRLAIARRAER